MAGAAGYFCDGEHGSAAGGGAAVAVLCLVGGVVEVVLIGEFFTGGDVAQGHDKDAVITLYCFAVGGAGVIDEHGGAEAVYDVLFVAVAEEVGDDAVAVSGVCDALGHAGSVVLAHDPAFAEGARCVAAGSVDCRRADDETVTQVCTLKKCCGLPFGMGSNATNQAVWRQNR